MKAREAVLERIRVVAAHAAPHPGRFRSRGVPPQARLWPLFSQALAGVGGQSLGPFGVTDLRPGVLESCLGHDVKRVLASPAVARRLGPGPWQTVAADVPPQTLADVDVALFEGLIGVAENGAVALSGREAPLRALPFLCRRLVLLLQVGHVVADMHAATRAMPADATRWHHFTWISGPSKTADIEQTLVQGAHGPYSLHVVGLRSE